MNIDDRSKLDSGVPKAKEVAHAIETLSFDARGGVAVGIDADSVCTRLIPLTPLRLFPALPCLPIPARS
jgi:hypothetical protein